MTTSTISELREIVAKRDAIFKEIGNRHEWERNNRAFLAIMGAQPPVVKAPKVA